MTSGFPAWFLAGPTASGKTDVAHWLARTYGFDLLSADAMQVYRGMDIGTAKPTPAEREGIRYHGIDLVDPGQSFSLAAYLEAAHEAFQACAARGGRMLVVGGTGLYLSALLQGLDPHGPPAPRHRAHWAGMLQDHGIEALQAEAENRRPGVLKQMPDPRNPRRLIRVLERMEQGLEPLPDRSRDAATEARDCAPLPTLWFPPPVLSERIEHRIRRMFAAGFVEEVATLHARGILPGSDTARSAIGYREVQQWLRGAISEETARQGIATRTRQLAKRQRTWFRHQFTTTWIDGPANAEDIPRVADAIATHWRTHGHHTVFRCSHRPAKPGS